MQFELPETQLSVARLQSGFQTLRAPSETLRSFISESIPSIDNTEELGLDHRLARTYLRSFAVECEVPVPKLELFDHPQQVACGSFRYSENLISLSTGLRTRDLEEVIRHEIEHAVQAKYVAALQHFEMTNGMPEPEEGWIKIHPDILHAAIEQRLHESPSALDEGRTLRKSYHFVRKIQRTSQITDDDDIYMQCQKLYRESYEEIAPRQAELALRQQRIVEGIDYHEEGIERCREGLAEGFKWLSYLLQADSHLQLLFLKRDSRRTAKEQDYYQAVLEKKLSDPRDVELGTGQKPFFIR